MDTLAILFLGATVIALGIFLLHVIVAMARGLPKVIDEAKKQEDKQDD